MVSENQIFSPFLSPGNCGYLFYQMFFHDNNVSIVSDFFAYNV